MSYLTWAKWEWGGNIEECENFWRDKVEVSDVSLSITFYIILTFRTTLTFQIHQK